ncbi:uncharacterized protein LOC129759515 [Uranotaenia lowii]|uniref:uncharacterized protein LOC129759515 n=1 Tax=Uranotaenia lowii TaxID=190385 RepID=UPI00247ACA26|nr:uncharacterized protein LOC129759515 [Uranotaenia lowii]
MVQCDVCDDWYHLTCAGVTPSIEFRPWSCPKCQPALSIHSSATASSKRSRKVQLQLEQLEENRNLELKALQIRLEAIEAQKRLVDAKYKLLQSTVNDVDETNNTQSRVSRRISRQLTTDWLESISDVVVTPERAPTNDATFPTVPTGQLNGPTSNTPPTSSNQPIAGSTFPTTSGRSISDTHLPTWLVVPDSASTQIFPAVSEANLGQRMQQLSTDNHGGKRRSAVQFADKIATVGAPEQQYHRNPAGFFPHGEQVTPIPRAPSQDRAPVPHPPQDKYKRNQRQGKTVPNSLRLNSDQCNEPHESLISQLGHCPPSEYANITQHMNSFSPTPSQLAARQVIARDLPIFSGDPEDWPVFISHYTTSTLACGYNPVENLTRLQRCLKGVALESVRSSLLLPDLVPEIIDTLRFRFGRPDLIINGLLQKLWNIPAPKAEKLESLIEYGTAVQNYCAHLEASDQNAHLSNPSLLAALVNRLPVDYQMQWSAYTDDNSEVSLKEFGEFMKMLMKRASKVTSSKICVVPSRLEERTRPKRGALHAHTESSHPASNHRERRCSMCSRNHQLKECDEFKALTLEGRRRVVEQERLCRNCLNFHGHRPCRLSGYCNVNGCTVRHHPLLHSIGGQQMQNNAGESSVRSNDHQSNSNGRGPSAFEPSPPADIHVHRSFPQVCLLRFVPVTLHGKGNLKIDTFAFLDDGSSLTLIEEKLVDELGLQGQPRTLCLKWTGNKTRTEHGSKVIELQISGTDQRHHKLQDTRTVKELALTPQTLDFGTLSASFRHLRGLPIASYRNAIPRVLIGVNNLHLTVPLRTKEGQPQDPIATKTRLGWCVYGGTGYQDTSLYVHRCSCSGDDALHTAVRNYFALEDVGITGTAILESENDKRAKRILEEHTSRQGDRFQTALLWKSDYYEFPDSRFMAEKRFECLERKLKRNPKMMENVTKQIEEYQMKGYARLATEGEIRNSDPRKTWYLPLGVVVNPKKPEKIRMVWDAAATVKGVSLNSMLLKGPDQLTTLPWVLFRFRQYAVAVSGDISEMFHQIRIRPEDQQAQRFLWRTNPNKVFDVFVMQVATFGSTCSPASAQFIKNKNAREFADVYPRAVEGIIDCHYVDDHVDSFGTEEEAQRVAREVKAIHARGGFNIRGWRSNSVKILQGLGEATDPNPKELNTQHGIIERVLGMHWLPNEDTLAYSTNFQPQINDIISNRMRPTKRQVLKCLMSVFDPLGLLAAFVVQGKILLQDIWRAGTQWDEEINDQVFEKWTRWIDQFPLIADLQVPRCYYLDATETLYNNLELHIFADASEDAYAAVAYFRISINSKEYKCTLVASKTKVAPLRHWSIPRLELQAAVLAARLETFIKEGHTLQIHRTVFWSDSSTVLAWIRSDHRRYSSFVACRVSEILSTTSIADWRWISTKMNVADLATKWGQGGQLDVDGPWFNGPEFLKEEEAEWPRPKSIQPTVEEQKMCGVHQSLEIPDPLVDVSRFSKWERLTRAMAYVFRYFNNCKKTRCKISSLYPTQSELRLAEDYLFRMVQREAFPDEVHQLLAQISEPNKKQVTVGKGSKLYKLSPYLDEHQVLRVDGRIGAAVNVDNCIKYPVILAKQHRVSDLIIDFYHRKFHHANFETVVNELRQVYHIPQIRSRVKQIVKRCQYCKINNARPQIPRMAPLPAARLATCTRPFTFVGLDLFGPLQVKVGRSSVKRWIALFTCLTVRAVHVEVVFNLSTESCIMAVRRFVGRRGSPLEFYSDNGTNFRGADNVLQQQVSNIEEGLASTFTNTATKWVFIPPGTPHMGGAWERMVRSVKKAMETSVSACRKLSDEGLWTLAVEAEGIVNSRPLTYLPIEAAEQEALTPNHLLIGSSNGIKQPTVEQVDEKLALKNTWHQIQTQADTFWRRWIREYLPDLTRRTKWQSETRPICVGDLVIIVDEARRNGWVRGRVNEVIPGQDGRVRKAIVQTHRGLTRQSVSKLAVLDVGGEVSKLAVFEVATKGNPGSS